MNALAAACGAGVGLGLYFVLLGVRGTENITTRVRIRRTGIKWEQKTLRVALAVGIGVLVAAIIGWPVAALFAAGAAATLPSVFGGRRAQSAATLRIEAIAAWTEMLRDTLAGAAGIEGAIAATAAVSPLPIRAEVMTLAARLEQQRLVPALRVFAADLNDGTADLVVAALILASEHQARRLGELLGSLASAARDHATMRLRVEAGRARTRASLRVVVGSTLAMAAGLAILNRGYLSPYDSAIGQLVLLVIGTCFASAFVWMARLAAIVSPERFLSHETQRVVP